MPRLNSSNWAVNDQITAARLHDLNEDIDDMYQYGNDRGRVITAVSLTALRIDIRAFAYRIGQNSGQFAGATDTVVTNTATNYVEMDDTGTVQINTSGWTAGGAYARLATVTCSGGVVTAISLWKPDLVGGTLGASASFDQSNKTADYSVLSSDSNKVLTNVGASGGVLFTLPTPVVGEHYMFGIGAAQGVAVRVANSATQTLKNGETTIYGLGGGSIGLWVHLVAITTTLWLVKEIVGTWTQSPRFGYILGGYDGSFKNAISRISFSSEAVTEMTATLSFNNGDMAAPSGTTGGYSMGGASQSTVIDKFKWLMEVLTTLAATLDVGRNAIGAYCQSTTKGYCIGGDTTGGNTSTDDVDDINFSTETSANISDQLDTAEQEACGVTSEGTAGYIPGGGSGGAPDTLIQKLLFSGEVTSTVADALAAAMNSQGGNVQNGTTAGYVGGGGGGASSAIVKITYSTESDSTLAATLTLTMSNMAGSTKAAVKGYWMGARLAATYSANIEDLTFSGETNVQISATISDSRGYGGGCMDNIF